MEAETGQFWLALAFQIPLVVAVGWLVAKGIFVTGREAEKRESAIRSQMEARDAEHKLELQRRNDTLTAEIEYREKLRAEEREARLRAEDRLAIAVKSMDEVTQFLSAIEKEIIRGR